jgi:flagellar basal-body rod protein FlgB
MVWNLLFTDGQGVIAIYMSQERVPMPQPTGLFDGTLSILQRTLNLRSAQHQAMASNIANADTPNYRAFEVAVEEELRRQRPEPGRIECTRTRANHLPLKVAGGAERVKLKAAAAPGFSLRADGNTVDLDRAMGELAENSLKYKTSAQLLSAKLKSLRNVIQGGR